MTSETHDRLNASPRTRILTTLLSPWSVDALRRSFFPSATAPPSSGTATVLGGEEAAQRRKGAAFKVASAAATVARAEARRAQERGGGMSCLRLSGMSEGEVHADTHTHMHRDSSTHSSKCLYLLFSPTPARMHGQSYVHCDTVNHSLSLMYRRHFLRGHHRRSGGLEI